MVCVPKRKKRNLVRRELQLQPAPCPGRQLCSSKRNSIFPEQKPRKYNTIRTNVLFVLVLLCVFCSDSYSEASPHGFFCFSISCSNNVQYNLLFSWLSLFMGRPEWKCLFLYFFALPVLDQVSRISGIPGARVSVGV